MASGLVSVSEMQIAIDSIIIGVSRVRGNFDGVVKVCKSLLVLLALQKEIAPLCIGIGNVASKLDDPIKVGEGQVVLHQALVDESTKGLGEPVRRGELNKSGNVCKSMLIHIKQM